MTAGITISKRCICAVPQPSDLPDPVIDIMPPPHDSGPVGGVGTCLGSLDRSIKAYAAPVPV